MMTIQAINPATSEVLLLRRTEARQDFNRARTLCTLG